MHGVMHVPGSLPKHPRGSKCCLGFQNKEHHGKANTHHHRVCKKVVQRLCTPHSGWYLDVCYAFHRLLFFSAARSGLCSLSHASQVAWLSQSGGISKYFPSAHLSTVLFAGQSLSLQLFSVNDSLEGMLMSMVGEPKPCE